ncbi:MAG: polyprenyl synthetase family protein [Bacteroidetes bacterium]|nr:polyprenyl synthetase family protein [Bacteroidota bacterium]MCL5738195.1 polyprenyl synthetase family protein [Bacteroidota bacterium]
MKNFTEYFEQRRLMVESELEGSLELVADSPLEGNIEYVFSMGGKRVRPLLTILAAEAVGKFNKDVLHAAAAIEILHNFTLVHDDIMDNADTRRGKTTVHVTSGVNTAILVGDLMMALAYDCLEKCSKEHLREGLQIFNEGVKQVCDGQALDESLSKVDGATMPAYIDMISKKTGALLMAAGKLGGLLGGGTSKEIDLLGNFGLNIGIAFQILDDMLDLEGDVERFGKPRGLDIIEKKKNYLFLKAQQSLDEKRFEVVNAAYRKSSISETDVVSVRDTYRDGGIFNAAKNEVADYTVRALESLKMLKESDGKDALVELANSLVQRKF